jgi:hypothetical protein
MSRREDIVDGSEARSRSYGLVYTCNLGWLDLGHMNPARPDRTLERRRCGAKFSPAGRMRVRPGAHGRMAARVLRPWTRQRGARN